MAAAESRRALVTGASSGLGRSLAAWLAARSFMESLRVDLSTTGVRTTCVFPGFVKSEMTAPNEFPMPFLLETDDAAARIGRAILARRAELWFPWQMALLARPLALLPSGLYVRLIRRTGPKRQRG